MNPVTIGIATQFLNTTSQQFETAPPTGDEPYAIREKLMHLAGLLPGAIRFRNACRRAAAPQARRRRRWKEGVLFSFHPAIDREWQTQRERDQDGAERCRRAVARRRPEDARASEQFGDGCQELASVLTDSIAARRIARGVRTLREGVNALADDHVGACDIADLLALQDDVVFFVLEPAAEAAFCVYAEGIESYCQLEVLLAELLAKELGCERPDARVVAAYRGELAWDAELVANASFSMYPPNAVQSNGGLPHGIAGCDRWLWGTSKPAVIPERAGERMILLGSPPFHVTWQVERRFSNLRGDVRLVERLSRDAVQEWMVRLGLVGQEPCLSRAA